MIKGRLTKLFVIFVGIIFYLPSIVIFSSMYTISNSYAQEKTVAIGADKIKAILLRPEGWIGEWHCASDDVLVNLVFEERGKKIVVKIHNPYDDISCKRKVKINSDGFRMSGCYAGIVDLFYDPNDNMYPFKTKGDNLECDLKVKAKWL
ncbi:MAG: hypothetical protein GY699_06265 [Desulfobacteraceae bacterium]|nr:hypothetical protein [Desulfobacteraceae bacterium]